MGRLRRRNIKHTFAPDKGLAQNVPPTMISERQCPDCNNSMFRFGEVSKSSGYTLFGSDGQPLSFNGTAGLRVMALIDFATLVGAVTYMALTLEDAFIYDGSKKRWRAMGLVVEDCEDAWVAANHVNPSVDTSGHKVGSKCCKFVATSSYTGNAMFAYEDDTIGDISTYNKVHFWIKSTLAQDSGDLILRFAQNITLGGTVANVTIPALAADTWYYLSLEASLGSINSCDSVGLVTSAGFDDSVTQTIWIDDVRLSTKFTNTPTAEDQWTWCSQAGAGASQEASPEWYLILTNGKSAPSKWDGSTAELAALEGTLGAGSITTSKVAVSYKDTLGLMNNTENSNNIPQRFRFGDTAEEDDWTTGVAGYIDCYDTPGPILAATILGPYLVVYKEDGIILLEYNAEVDPVFNKTPRITGSQFFATKAVASANNIDYFLARDNVYAFTGLHEAVKIGDPIRDELLENFDFANKSECFAYIQPGKHRITFVTPVKASTTLNCWYTYDFLEKTWSKGKWNDYMTCAGRYEGGEGTSWSQLSGLWSALLGSWADLVQEKGDKTILLGDKDGYVYQLADNLTDYNGTAIDSEWQTKDFALSPDYMNRNMRFGKVSYAARGDLVSVSYSTDEGNTWTSLVTDQSLSSKREEYSISLNFSAPRARFKFFDATAGKNFFISQVSVEYMSTTTRD